MQPEPRNRQTPATKTPPVPITTICSRACEQVEPPPFWVVSRHADIMEIERAADVFKNARRTLLRKSAVDDQIRKVSGGRPFLLNNLTNMDGVEP